MRIWQCVVIFSVVLGVMVIVVFDMLILMLMKLLLLLSSIVLVLMLFRLVLVFSVKMIVVFSVIFCVFGSGCIGVMVGVLVLMLNCQLVVGDMVFLRWFCVVMCIVQLLLVSGRIGMKLVFRLLGCQIRLFVIVLLFGLVSFMIVLVLMFIILLKFRFSDMQ